MIVSRRKAAISLICVLVVMALAGACTTAQPCGTSTTNVDAKAAARCDAATPEGRAWMIDNEWLAEAVRSVAESCKELQPEGANQAFTAYLKLAKTGTASEAVVDPNTPFSRCFGEGARTIVFSNVPRDGFWFELEMRMEPRALAQ